MCQKYFCESSIAASRAARRQAPGAVTQIVLKLVHSRDEEKTAKHLRRKDSREETEGCQWSMSSVIKSSLQNSVAVSFSLYCKFCYAARSVLRAGPVVHVLAVLRLDTGATHALLLAQWSMSLLCCAWTQMRLGTQLVNLLAEGCLSPLNLVALSIQGVLSLISIQIRQVSRLGRTPMCPNQSDACQIHCSAYNWSLSR